MQSGLPIIDSFTSDPTRTLLFLVALVIGVTVHEFAHAWMAARQGDYTAKYLGRVSLNPAAHLDPAGSFLFLLAGIGWGRPVPVNPYNLKDGRRGDFLVSIAGILMNLLVAFIFALPFQIMAATGSGISLADLATGNNVWLVFCQQMIGANLLLAAFNLLPIPPLDGSKALGIIIPRSWDEGYDQFLRYGPVVLLAIFMVSFIAGVNLIGPVIDPIMAAFGFLIFLPTSIL
jgi:Zn-dependent protease